MSIHKIKGQPYDEEDTIFSRMALKKGSKAYEAYYRGRPELKDVDDDLRGKPFMFEQGTATYNPYVGPLAMANFDYMSDFMELVSPKIQSERTEVDASAMTKLIKHMVIQYGAGAVGICEMDDDMYYACRGRREHRGTKIDASMKHRYGIVFTLPMNQEMMLYAPGLPAAIEVSNAYVKAATIGMQIAYYIAHLGYPVRNHMDANYLVIAPLVAHAAGLGEFGRQGMLITPEHGPNVRLGVVTTDMPLLTDQPIDFGVQVFCKHCSRCVKTCPGKAISKSDDASNWRIDHESCHNRWRSLGTDCSICLTNCPYTYQMADAKDIEGSLAAYDERFGIRPYNRTKPDWMIDYMR